MKPIEVKMANLIECDSCDYKIENPSGDPNIDTAEYINVPCPKCGANLLTQEDYDLHNEIMKEINKVNKRWWLSIFSCKSKNVSTFDVKIHDGIKINKK